MRGAESFETQTQSLKGQLNAEASITRRGTVALHWSDVSTRKVDTSESTPQHMVAKRPKQSYRPAPPSQASMEVMTWMLLAEALGQGTTDLVVLPTTSEVSASLCLCSLLRAHGEGVL